MERKDRFLTLLRSSFNDDWQADGRSRADVSNPASGGGNGSLPQGNSGPRRPRTSHGQGRDVSSLMSLQPTSWVCNGCCEAVCSNLPVFKLLCFHSNPQLPLLHFATPRSARLANLLVQDNVIMKHTSPQRQSTSATVAQDTLWLVTVGLAASTSGEQEGKECATTNECLNPPSGTPLPNGVLNPGGLFPLIPPPQGTNGSTVTLLHNETGCIPVVLPMSTLAGLATVAVFPH
eukprot:2545369-Amphidinium_carterae.1